MPRYKFTHGGTVKNKSIGLPTVPFSYSPGLEIELTEAQFGQLRECGHLLVKIGEDKPGDPEPKAKAKTKKKTSAKRRWGE